MIPILLCGYQRLKFLLNPPKCYQPLNLTASLSKGVCKKKKAFVRVRCMDFPLYKQIMQIYTRELSTREQDIVHELCFGIKVSEN